MRHSTALPAGSTEEFPAMTQPATTVDTDRPWHGLPVAEIFAALVSQPDGLAADEARRRLLAHGPNRLPAPRPRPAWRRLLAQFNNVLIYVLLAAGAITALLQHWVDAGVILGVVLINALIGFAQEGKAEDALQAIRQMLSPQALALRDGHLVTLDAADLIPGDVVQLQPGDRIPADLRLIRIKGLQIDEAALTGESVPVEKITEPVPADADLADRRCMAYCGTLVTRGQGAGLVVATARATEIGRISALVASVTQLTTPLLRQMAQFGRWLTAAILLLAAASFVFGVFVRDNRVAEMFLAAVGLAVAAIPEGLPAIMTITLAIGVRRMAARNAIIRRLPAVETLGTVAVICTDKTGTLTRDRMTVASLLTAQDRFEFSGSGDDPRGSLLRDGQLQGADDDPALQQALRAAILCNDATLTREAGVWRVNGDPMEGALIVAGIKAGLDPEDEARRFPRRDLIPFDSGHQYMATLHHDQAGAAVIYLKGAPEVLLERCGAGREPLDVTDWRTRLDALAAAGQRVLAVAMKTADPGQTRIGFDDVRDGLEFLGLFGLMDPPREEAIIAVGHCREAGIQVKMITGDHAATARAIARQVGIDGERVLTGRELDALDDDALRQLVGAVNVYARVTPEHKLRLVRLLQETGRAVAMTGDGVNDAPALKRADVGIAMGVKGTEAAKEAAEVVLADDNFASIAHAVEEGRTIHDNLRKALLFILPTSGGQALAILGAILFGFRELPLTAVQILWVNLITAVTLALALAFEPPEPNVMRRPPRPLAEPLLTPLLAWRTVFVSLIMTAGTFALFLWAMERGADIAYARTLAVNTLVLFEIFYLFSARYISAPVLNRAGLLGNPYVLLTVGLMILLQLAFTYLGPMQILFGTAPLDAGVWFISGLVASTVLMLVELEKAVLRLFHPSRLPVPPE
jgi:magnesium-transporting ATPase (P-type)